MLEKLLKFFFGDARKKALKEIYPLITQINEKYATLNSLTDEQIQARIQEIKSDLKNELEPEFKEVERLREIYITESDDTKKDRLSKDLDNYKDKVKEKVQDLLNDVLVEVFAIVKDTCRRLVGHTYLVRGNEVTWDMVPYDCQLIGGIVLHQGKIAEMATGEGKTLVATLPMFLNALVGKGVHLVTVNEYLAQRDSEWMSPIFEFHGMKIGCILNGMDFDDKKAMYQCDVTYGMNSEFGFDYLRDNMAVHSSQLVQRAFYYAIVDEVDSILIDEARTPLIISGQVDEDKNFYQDLRPHIEKLFNLQNVLIRDINTKISKMLKEDNCDYNEVGRLLLLMKYAAPKHKALSKYMKDGELKKLCNDTEGVYIRDKKTHVLNAELYYSIDEKTNTVELSEKGQLIIDKYEKDLFIVSTLDELLEEVDKDDTLTDEQKLVAKDKVTRDFMDKSEKQHDIKQLLRAFSLFEKEKDYVVMDNVVEIVDEFTGRRMPGRRYSDGLHQAIEAKERVQIQKASQTLATITLQNYFRMFDKLAGMTGTAITEEGEFDEIYHLKVMEIPTNKPIARSDHDDIIYLTKNEKYKAIIREITYWHEKNKPVLVGTTSVEASESLSRMLRLNRIPHNVLNAKNHQREAEIVQNAGQAGAVTIATNMAGRGTDIKLGEGVVTRTNEDYVNEDNSCSEKNIYGGPIDGLHVIGSERHESRRIDRQLRGRAGRQGDPGTSRFYVSLEDDLMRLFGSDRMTSVLSKFNFKESDSITHPLMTKGVSTAQKRVEEHNFEIRKHLIKYDEVMTAQREIIYQYRNNVLRGYDLKSEIIGMIQDTVVNVIYNTVPQGQDYPSDEEVEAVCKWVRLHLNVPIEYEKVNSPDIDLDVLKNTVIDYVMKSYESKEEIVGSENQRELERRSLLETVDTNWREHLREMDLLQEGINLRAYGNKDPLIEYKKESYAVFERLIFNIQEQVTQKVFTRILISQATTQDVLDRIKTRHQELNAYGQDAKSSSVAVAKKPTMPKMNRPAPEQKIQPVVKAQKIGRNDPCPCGSGLKYKKCCGKKVNDDEK